MTTPIDRESVEQALAELEDVVRCRCHEAYKGRGLHDPDCQCDSAEAVATLRAALAAMEEGLTAVHMAGYMDGKKAAEAENKRLREALSGNQIWERAEKIDADEFVLWTVDGHVAVRMKITHRHEQLSGAGLEFLTCDLLDLLNSRAALQENPDG